MNRSTGLVLAGAVAKGAYEAGVLTVLASERVAFRRIAGTSSGALNAAMLAAGVATGRVALAARIMEDTWRDHAAWHDAVEVSPRSILGLQGLASVERMRASLLVAIERVLYATDSGDMMPAYPDVEFRLVGTDLGSMTATHERPFTFRGTDFESAEGRERIALAAVASAAFPGLFAPVQVEGGFIADGGITNNTAISYLIEPPEVDRVIVVSASASRTVPLTAAPHGAALIAEILEIMIDERLSRDVRATRRANERLASVQAELGRLALGKDHGIVRALGLRHVEVVEIRPVEDLDGTPFSGLLSATLRADYIASGKQQARATLGLDAA